MNSKKISSAFKFGNQTAPQLFFFLIKQFQIIRTQEKSRSMYEKMRESILTYKDQFDKIHKNLSFLIH